MTPAKLIIVEGLPGLGKSTTAQHIAIALEKLGIPCRWYYEADFENPVSGFYEPQFHGSPPEFVRTQEAKWHAFAEACAADDAVTILESSLFQETIFGLLQYNVPQSEIHGFVHDIVRIIAPLRPVVIYLVHDQPAVAIRRVCDMRGPSVEDVYLDRNDESPFAKRRDLFGFLGLARFWSEYKSIADGLYDELRFRKLRLDVTRGHTDEHELRVIAFLGLPPIVERPVSQAYLERFVGTYLYRIRGDLRTFSVDALGGTLMVRNCPCLWPENRLLPRDRNAFYAESWPYLVMFEEDPSGRVAAMRVDDEGRTGTPVERFDKVL